MSHEIARLLRVLIVDLVLILALGSTNASRAQTAVSQDKAEAFVRAAMAIDDVMRQWTPRIRRAPSEAHAALLREQANAAARAAVRDAEGISLEEYRTIYDALRDDPEMAERITGMFEQQGRQ